MCLGQEEQKSENTLKSCPDINHEFSPLRSDTVVRLDGICRQKDRRRSRMGDCLWPGFSISREKERARIKG
jgi:hypothetical protein